MTHNKIYLLQLKFQIPPKHFVIPGIFFFKTNIFITYAHNNQTAKTY